jgi:hypothetical protein
METRQAVRVLHNSGLSSPSSRLPPVLGIANPGVLFNNVTPTHDPPWDRCASLFPRQSIADQHGSGLSNAELKTWLENVTAM